MTVIVSASPLADLTSATRPAARPQGEYVRHQDTTLLRGEVLIYRPGNRMHLDGTTGYK
jgi:hypothetical protein